MVFFLAATLFTSPILAESNANLFSEKLKASANQMVQDVKRAADPEAKREILSDYLAKMEFSMKEAKAKPFLKSQEKQAIGTLEGKFQQHLLALGNPEESEFVSDNELDGFAQFVQQDIEQAGISSGGVYLSTGALILLVVIQVVLF